MDFLPYRFTASLCEEYVVVRFHRDVTFSSLPNGWQLSSKYTYAKYLRFSNFFWYLVGVKKSFCRFLPNLLASTSIQAICKFAKFNLVFPIESGERRSGVLSPLHYESGKPITALADCTIVPSLTSYRQSTS